MTGLCEVNDEEPSSKDTRPFGLKYVTDSNSLSRGELDFTALDYDFDRQIAVMRDGASVLPVFKHTSGSTSTETARADKNAPDTDTDVEYD
jgi:putative ATP-grasp target RiPP